MRDEEKKVYSVVGRVEIGTDEYRDLVEGLAEAKHEAEESRSQKWEAKRETDKVLAELNKANAEKDAMKKYLIRIGQFENFAIWQMTGEKEEE